MAAEKKSKKTAIDRLTPNAFTVTVNGEDVRVAASREENTILNMFLASRLRSVIEKTMNDYKDDEVKFTPKELRDLAAAARDVAAFSAEVYLAAEPIQDSPKPAESPTDVTDISFESLHTPPEVKDETNEQST